MGETAIFQGPGSPELAIRWLKAALAAVEALPTDPVWADGTPMLSDAQR